MVMVQNIQHIDVTFHGKVPEQVLLVEAVNVCLKADFCFSSVLHKYYTNLVSRLSLSLSLRQRKINKLF